MSFFYFAVTVLLTRIHTQLYTTPSVICWALVIRNFSLTTPNYVTRGPTSKWRTPNLPTKNGSFTENLNLGPPGVPYPGHHPAQDCSNYSPKFEFMREIFYRSFSSATIFYLVILIVDPWKIQKKTAETCKVYKKAKTWFKDDKTIFFWLLWITIILMFNPLWYGKKPFLSFIYFFRLSFFFGKDLLFLVKEKKMISFKRCKKCPP